MIKCKICDEEFTKGHNWKHNMTSQEYYDKFIKSNVDGICIVCGKPTIFHKQKFYYDKYCSKECKNILEPKQYSNYRNRAQAVKTCQKKFNGKLNSGAWNSRRNTIKEFEKNHNCTSIKKLTRLYGQGWKVLNLPKIMINKQNSAISNEYLPQIIEYSNTYHNSIVQQNLVNFIKSIYDGDILLNDRQIIKPNELDVVLPNLSIAIEFNGTRWHSIELGLFKDYHLNKSLLCREKGIRLIHIYEFEDLDKQKQLLKDLILGQDNYPKHDFNKNNLIKYIPMSEVIYQDKKYTLYGAGKLY